MTKIDYEITVNVSSADIETKKQVQDAFFNLGLGWRDSGNNHAHLDKSSYTNTYDAGVTTSYLMFIKAGRNPTHTINELLELAGMKNETTLRPFDLEKALNGEPVVLRSGEKAYVRHFETELKTNYPLIGYAGLVVGWTGEGCFLRGRDSILDIVGMWSEPLIFEHWDLLHPELKWIAKDLDGSWYAYPEKPERFQIGWSGEWGSKGSSPLDALAYHLFPECDWKESLIERPENE